MKILILNNDLMERTVIQQVLQANRHEVVVAETSETALQLLHQGDIQIMIADRVTTNMDERELLKNLRALKTIPYVYVLLVTVRVQDTDLATRQAGVDDYLHKPVAPAELKVRVQIGERTQELRRDLVEAREVLDNTAIYDATTGLLSPNAFLALSRGEIERARRNQAPLSLLALNVINFLDIQTNYGDDVSRDVLVVISRAIREKSRPYDNAGLFDRSVFMIPLPFVIGQDAEKIAARLYKGIINTTVTLLDGTSIPLNLGIAIISTARVTVTTDMEKLITKARETLTHINRAGGNRVEMVFV